MNIEKRIKENHDIISIVVGIFAFFFVAYQISVTSLSHLLLFAIITGVIEFFVSKGRLIFGRLNTVVMTGVYFLLALLLLPFPTSIVIAGLMTYISWVVPLYGIPTGSVTVVALWIISKMLF